MVPACGSPSYSGKPTVTHKPTSIDLPNILPYGGKPNTEGRITVAAALAKHLKFSRNPKILISGEPKAWHTNLFVEPNINILPVIGKPLILGNFALVSGKPIILGNFVSLALGKPSNFSGKPKDKPTIDSVAFNRNQNHLNVCNTVDDNLLSKSHLPDDLCSVLYPHIHTPDDEQYIPSNWFLAAIKTITETPCPAPKPAPFKFSTYTASIAHNTQLLQNTSNDFAKIINDH